LRGKSGKRLGTRAIKLGWTHIIHVRKSRGEIRQCSLSIGEEWRENSPFPGGDVEEGKGFGENNLNPGLRRREFELPVCAG